jgi:hypothetical protein
VNRQPHLLGKLHDEPRFADARLVRDERRTAIA